MSEKRWKPPYFILTTTVVVSGLLTYGMYSSFIQHSIGSPTNAAATRTVSALDPNGQENNDPRPELPVWPPPSATAPVDPAANPMQGARPMRIDWPDAAGGQPARSAH